MDNDLVAEIPEDVFNGDGLLTHRKYPNGYEAWYYYDDGIRVGMKDSNGYSDGVCN